MSGLAARVGIGAIALAAASGLFVLIVGGFDSTEAATAQPKRAAAASVTRIVVRDGEPVGGAARLVYRRGERVQFSVESDEADEVHVHGFDLMREVSEEGSVRFSFPATIEGVFEIELEGSGVEIAELRITP